MPNLKSQGHSQSKLITTRRAGHSRNRTIQKGVFWQHYGLGPVSSNKVSGNVDLLWSTIALRPTRVDVICILQTERVVY